MCDKTENLIDNEPLILNKYYTLKYALEDALGKPKRDVFGLRQKGW